MLERLKAMPPVLEARWRSMRMRQQERRALMRFGERIAAAAPDPRPDMRAVADEVAAHDRALAELAAALDASLQADRSDYAAVSIWVRPLVIVRGIAVRSVLRHRRHLTRTQRGGACARLGVAAIGSSLQLDGDGAGFENAARMARAEAECAEARAVALLAPLGGALLPPAARHVGREARELGKSVLKEMRGQVVPRAPALAALGVGWWVASTFTDSQLSATLHSLGIGSGPRHAVDSETYQALNFWLPIGAAAICSYAGNRLAAVIRSRYGASDASPPQR
jgi:hypothetical protein